MVDAYVYPTRASRIRVAARDGGLFLAFILFGKVWIPFVRPRLEGDGCAAGPWIYASAAFLCILLLIPAMLCGRAAVFTAKSRIYPYPGALLLFRTPISTGAGAIFMAAWYAMFSAALTFGIFCILYVFYLACGPTLVCRC